jgi:hypothetical protein
MKSLDDLLVKSNVDLSDWPSNEEELDAFLIACDGCDLGIENHDARISNVFGLIDESPLRPISFVSHESQGCLFDLVDPQSEELTLRFTMGFQQIELLPIPTKIASLFKLVGSVVLRRRRLT